MTLRGCVWKPGRRAQPRDCEQAVGDLKSHVPDAPPAVVTFAERANCSSPGSPCALSSCIFSAASSSSSPHLQGPGSRGKPERHTRVELAALAFSAARTHTTKRHGASCKRHAPIWGDGSGAAHCKLAAGGPLPPAQGRLQMLLAAAVPMGTMQNALQPGGRPQHAPASCWPSRSPPPPSG